MSAHRSLAIISVFIPTVVGCRPMFAQLVTEVALSERCAEIGSSRGPSQPDMKRVAENLPYLRDAACWDPRARILQLEAEWLMGFSILDASGESSDGLDQALRHFQRGKRDTTHVLSGEWSGLEAELTKVAAVDDAGECDVNTRVAELRLALSREFPTKGLRSEQVPLFTLLGLHMAGEALLSDFGGACSSLATILGVFEHAATVEDEGRDLFLDRSFSCPGVRGVAQMLSVVMMRRASRFQPASANEELIQQRVEKARARLGEPRWLDFVISKYGEVPLEHSRLCQMAHSPRGLYSTPLHRFLDASADVWYASELEKTPCLAQPFAGRNPGN